MNRRVFALAAASVVTWLVQAQDEPIGPPSAVLDLTSARDLAQVSGVWRYADARVVDADFRGPGPDRKPTGSPVRTQVIEPAAGAADFDDSTWPVIEPATLADRRGNGRVSFNWYRLEFTVPQSLGNVECAGASIVFEIVVDDYAEVWVDGVLAPRLGQAHGGVVCGWNVGNRVVVVRDAVAGRKVKVAVFGINGPISSNPANFIWVRSAALQIFTGPRSLAPQSVAVKVERRHPALDEIVTSNVHADRLATGFQFTEGPVWTRDGAWIFSDPNANRQYRLDAGGSLTVLRERSGYGGADVREYGQPGSNGNTFDGVGRLTFCQHGNRRVVRQEEDGSIVVLADRWDGRRLNSPNDLVYRSDGALFFTDPPFGLPKFHDDRRRELPFCGVFCVKDGVARPVARDLSGPNGIAFTPDERFAYVTNWDPRKKVVMRYSVGADGTFSEPTVFFDMSAVGGEIALDGLKVDVRGNLFVSGPGGIWVIDARGTHLGTLALPELPANFAWGGEDGRTLFLTARTSVYRMAVLTGGAKPAEGGPPRR